MPIHSVDDVGQIFIKVYKMICMVSGRFISSFSSLIWSSIEVEVSNSALRLLDTNFSVLRARPPYFYEIVTIELSTRGFTRPFMAELQYHAAGVTFELINSISIIPLQYLPALHSSSSSSKPYMFKQDKRGLLALCLTPNDNLRTLTQLDYTY